MFSAPFLARLPSRCELFNISSNIPSRKYLNENTKRLLGWHPKDSFERRWTRAL